MLQAEREHKEELERKHEREKRKALAALRSGEEATAGGIHLEKS